MARALFPARWVYFIQEGEDGPIKIGQTEESPEKRLSSLQTGNPRQLRLIGVVRNFDERSMHERFGAERLRGEWFESSERLLEFVHNIDYGRILPFASLKRP